MAAHRVDAEVTSVVMLDILVSELLCCGCWVNTSGLLHAAAEQPAANLEANHRNGEDDDGRPQRGRVSQQVCNVAHTFFV